MTDRKRSMIQVVDHLTGEVLRPPVPFATEPGYEPTVTAPATEAGLHQHAFFCVDEQCNAPAPEGLALTASSERPTTEVPNHILVCLDELTPEQYAEDRPHLMRAADRGAWRHAANVVVPSGRTYRMEGL